MSRSYKVCYEYEPRLSSAVVGLQDGRFVEVNLKSGEIRIPNPVRDNFLSSPDLKPLSLEPAVAKRIQSILANPTSIPYDGIEKYKQFISEITLAENEPLVEAPDAAEQDLARAQLCTRENKDWYNARLKKLGFKVLGKNQ